MDQLALSAMLADITAVRQRNELLRQYKGYGFNLIRLLGAETDEVKICRLIYELLSPDGSHGQKSKFLKLFYSMVLKQTTLSETEIDTSLVEREYFTPAGRRIDLFIKVGAYSFPIEVKIHAGDQKDQCKDYYDLATAPDGEERTMYYLTLDGHDPSGYSLGTAKGIHVVPISFASGIIPWLDACAKAVLDTTRLRESILQMKQVLEEVCGIMEEKERTNIVSVLQKSYDNFKSAEAMQDAVWHMKDELLRAVFRDIGTKASAKAGKKQLDHCIDKDDADRLSKYYINQEEYPGISFLYKELADGIQIWVRAELSSTFCVRYCHVKSEGNGKFAKYDRYLTNHQDICKELNIREEDIYEKGGWWLTEEKSVMPWDKKDIQQAPDFKACNKAWFDLFDGAKRDEFTTAIADRIVQLLNH